MLNFTYQELYDYQNTFKKLVNHNFKDIKLSFEIFKFAKQIDTHLQEVSQFLNELNAKYLAGSPDGSIEPLIKNEQDANEYQKNLNEFMQTKCNINEANFTISLEDLEGGNFTPLDFNCLSHFMIMNTEEVEQN